MERTASVVVINLRISQLAQELWTWVFFCFSFVLSVVQLHSRVVGRNVNIIQYISVYSFIWFCSLYLSQQEVTSIKISRSSFLGCHQIELRLLYHTQYLIKDTQNIHQFIIRIHCNHHHHASHHRTPLSRN